MKKTEIKKALYLTLSAILGAGVFLIIERGILLLLFLLGVDISAKLFLLTDFFVGIFAVFLGLWYGIFIGLHWYDWVYERAGDFSEKTVPTPATDSLKSKITKIKNEPMPAWNMEDLKTTPMKKVRIKSAGKKDDAR